MMPIDYDMDAIMRELDELERTAKATVHKVVLTPDQAKILWGMRLDRKIKWSAVLVKWKQLGFPGSETTLIRLVKDEEARRKAESKERKDVGLA
jgi:hypothetical protein